MLQVGAGIQVPPNSTRILKYLGIYERFLKVVVWPECINLRRYQNGEMLSKTPLDPEMTEVYGNPYWLIHRPDYHNLLHKAAVENGCEIRVNSRVVAVDESVPSLTLKNGEMFKVDIIVGADGIKPAYSLANLRNQIGNPSAGRRPKGRASLLRPMRLPRYCPCRRTSVRPRSSPFHRATCRQLLDRTGPTSYGLSHPTQH